MTSELRQSNQGAEPSRRTFLAATGGLALNFMIVPAPRAGRSGLSSRRASESMSAESVPAAWEEATSPPSPGSVPTSSPCAMSTTSAPPVRSAHFPRRRRYKDFREMIDKEAKHIDAVTVGTPDHIHAVASMAAIRAGKHVYCQKPLTHTLHECRELTKAARDAGVATQMGNQGHATEGARLTNEWIQAGIIGTVQRGSRLVGPRRPAVETGHRPPHRHASRAQHARLEPLAGPDPRAAVQPGVRPGELARLVGLWHRGDGRHGLPHHRSSRLGAPARAARASSRRARPSTARSSTATSPTPRPIRSPRSSTYEFPARGDLPPVRMTWYDGGLMPPAPAELPGRRALAR